MPEESSSNLVVEERERESHFSSSDRVSGQIHLQVEEYLSLVKQIDELKRERPPCGYVISEVRLEGEVKVREAQQCVDFSVSVLLQQLQGQWSCIPILSTSVVITSSSVCAVEEGEGNMAPDKSLDAFLGVNGHHHSLYVNKKGAYMVKLHVKAPFASSRSHGVNLEIPQAVRNSLSFRMDQADMEIIATPSLGSCLTGEGDRKGRTPSGEGFTLLLCDVPPTNRLSIQWKEKVEEEELPESVSEQEKQVIVNVEQMTTHSIGEGTVQTSTEVNYSILHGSRAQFQVFVPTNTRILSVNGLAIKRWDVIMHEKKAELPEGDLEEGGNEDEKAQMEELLRTKGSKLLKIWLEYGMENCYQIILDTETDMESTSCDVVVPSFSCYDVNREKGYVSVVARTNVEVSELDQRSLTRIGHNELPDAMSMRSDNPPLLSYKFLYSGNVFLQVNVKKHDDAEVLVAAVESAHLEATLSEDKVLYSFIMQVRNTQTQYVRIRLPENSTVWSTLVASRAVKPARDEEGYVMVPLQKSQGNSDSKAFIVEVVYLTTLKSKMADKGLLSLSLCPLVDIPINQLFVTVKLPTSYEYAEFKGDLREIAYFGSTPPSASAPDQDQFLGISNMSNNFVPQQQQMVQMAPSSMRKRSVTSKGLLPVKIQMPPGGRCFYFERLLVMSESFSGTVEYLIIPTKKREIGNRRLFTLIRTIVLLILLSYLAILGWNHLL